MPSAEVVQSSLHGGDGEGSGGGGGDGTLAPKANNMMSNPRIGDGGDDTLVGTHMFS